MFLQQSFNKRHIPLANLFRGRRVIAREMERMVVMFKELRLEMRQRVMLAEQSPHTVATVITAMVELMCFHFPCVVTYTDAVLFSASRTPSF